MTNQGKILLMIRFAVLLFFFIHLAILLKARRFRWLGHLTGWGTCAIFIGLYAFSVEKNSDLTFILLAAMTAIAMIAAEIVASLLKKPEKS